MLKGSCLCGSVRYTITGEVSDFGYCHCTSCRKASGTAHGANIGVYRQDLELSDPNQFSKEYESSPGKFRVFCSHCGSPLFAYLKSNHDVVRIRLGTLDTPLGKTAKAHTFMDENPDWHQVEDSLPQFNTWPDKDVLVQIGSKQT